MGWFEAFVTWYLGVAPPAEGQRLQWGWDARSPWPQGLPPWATVLLWGVALAGLVRVYRRETARLPWRRAAVLLGLRLTAVALVLFLLSEPRLTVQRTGLPVLALLVDTSASMGFQDQPAAAKSASAAPSRLQQARRLMLDDGGSFLKRMLARNRLRVYQFSQTAAPLTGQEVLADDEVDGPLAKAIAALEPSGKATRPAPAVRQVLQEFRGSPPTAIVVLTDGIPSVSGDDRLSQAADQARQKGVPLYVVGIGSTAPLKDLQLADALSQDVAFVADPVLVSVKLRGFGYPGQSVPLELRVAGETAPVAAKSVTVPGEGQSATVELLWTPPKAGEYDLTVSVPGQPGEANLLNNAESRHLSVRDEKIRVLLVESRPRYEFRFLKQLLERDASVELQTLLQEADLEYAQEDRTAVSRFPIKPEELNRFDVVILGDVNLSLVGSAALDALVPYVRDHGGGVVMIAGPQFNPLRYAGTPLERLLPFELDAVTVPDPAEPIVRGFQPALAPDARGGNLLFRFAETEGESLAVWSRLPEWYWSIGIGKTKPGALVFVEHPTSGPDGRRQPLILQQRVGAGKVLYHATDELWRWRFRTGDLYFGRYWSQAIRGLSRSRLLGQDRSAELTADRLEYQQGDPVRLRVRFLNEAAAPASGDEPVAVKLEGRAGWERTLNLSRQSSDRTLYGADAADLPEGSYHAWVTQPAFPGTPPSVDFRVTDPQRELSERSLQRADLQLAARQSRGAYFDLANAAELPDALPAGTPRTLTSDEPIPLWSRWEALLLVAGVLTTEWILRKRWHLV